MAQIDIEYHKLLGEILNKGFFYEDPNRKGIKRIQIPHYTFKHDFKDGFPAITTKKLYFKGVVGELLWFLRGETNIEYLVDNGINIWTLDYNIWKSKYYNIQKGDLGKVYGHQFRNYGGDYKYKLQPNPKILYKKPILKVKKGIKGKYLGEEFISNSGFKYKVIDRVFKKGYTIQFISTGFIVRGVRSSTIVNGNIKDLYSPSIFGVACRGEIKEDRSTLLLRIEKTWYNMLKRCYNKNSKDYPQYGKKGVYVSNEWLIFSNFLKDVKKIKGWGDKLKDWDKYQLDKDILGDGFTYSIDSCSWVSKEINLNYKNNIYNLKNIKTGELVTTNNLNNFLEKRDIGKAYRSHFSLIEKGLRKSCKNWTIKSIIKNNPFIAGTDQIYNLIKGLKENPMGTKHIVTAWNPSELGNMALPPCHFMFQINCRPSTRDEKIVDPGIYHRFTLKWSQRSCDLFLGIPYNISSYALLAKIIGKLTNMIPDGIVGDLSNVHIYESHLNAVKKQLNNDPDKYGSCELEDFGGFKMDMYEDIDQWLSSKDVSDFTLDSYESYPTIKAEMLPYSK